MKIETMKIRVKKVNQQAVKVLGPGLVENAVIDVSAAKGMAAIRAGLAIGMGADEAKPKRGDK